MSSEKTLVYFGVGQTKAPALVRDFAETSGLRLLTLDSADGVQSLLNRAAPACLILDAGEDPETAISLCDRIKRDSFTAIVPVVILTPEGGDHLPAKGLQAGADEVVPAGVSAEERRLRLELVLRRAARDVAVHPTTRLPGTFQINRDLQDRMARGDQFAICYADLDHFKEFNDRYGYRNGDRVILLVSKILRDLIRSLSTDGFVGHIGGDDFIFNVSVDDLERCCDEVIHLFDELIPYQYSPEDRRAGYFLGKDRRGSIHRIPLMTLSIGVVTNQFQTFTHTAQISELAAEMKTYAKTVPGSVYVVDRRQADDRRGRETATAPAPGQEGRQPSSEFFFE